MTVALLVSCLACGFPAHPPEPADDVRAPSVPSEPLPEDSLYGVELPLVGADGESTSLEYGRGHPTLVSMFYASCPMACPLLIGEIRALEQGLEPEERADLRVLLVSLDPGRDTPEALAEARERYATDRDRWLLTRTDEEHVRTLAALLGITYRALSDGEMNHSSVVTLLDRQGRIVHQVDGLGKDPAPLVAAIREMR